MFHQSISEIIGKRSPRIVAPDQTVRDACYQLSDALEGAVAVVENDKLVGILGESDVIQRAICANRPTRETLVRDIMTPNPRTVDLDASLAQAMKVMADAGVRHLPVMLGDRLAGILSMRDIPTQYRLMVERFREFQKDHQSEGEPLTLLV